MQSMVRIKEKINKGIVFCYDTKLSGKANKDMNINDLGGFSFQILVVKGLVKVYNTLQMIFNRELSWFYGTIKFY